MFLQIIFMFNPGWRHIRPMYSSLHISYLRTDLHSSFIVKRSFLFDFPPQKSVIEHILLKTAFRGSHLICDNFEGISD